MMAFLKNTMEESFKKAGEYLGASAPKHRGTTRQDYIDFFIFFRNNGERLIGMTIENLVDEYIDKL